MDATTMYHKPWTHQQLMHQQMFYQQMLMEHHPYYSYAVNDHLNYSSSELPEEDNDHTGDEMPSDGSGDQSPHPDMFRLAFAASQWSKLVLNAEGLFNKLMSNSALPPNEQYLLKNQIEQWLCMKQEYEECIGGDDSGSFQGFTDNTKRSLERIEEVTETDEKTDESSHWMNMNSQTKSFSGSESEIYDDDDQSDLESENSDFLDKKDHYMNKLRIDTDDIVHCQKNDFAELQNILPVPEPLIGNSFVPVVKPIPIRNPASRRISLLPNSEMSYELAQFQKQNKIDQHVIEDTQIDSLAYLDRIEKSKERSDTRESIDEHKPSSYGSPNKMITKMQNPSNDQGIVDALRTLIIHNVEKMAQMKKLKSDLELTEKQLEELQNTIKAKEELLEEILQNCDARNSAKQKFQKKRSEVEEKNRNAEKVLNYKRMLKNTNDASVSSEEIKRYDDLLMGYDRKLKNIKIIKQVAGNSTKKIAYLESSLKSSRKQVEKLRQRLKDDNEHRKFLENAINANQRKVRDIEQNYKISALKLREVVSESDDEHNNLILKIKHEEKDENLSQTNDRISQLDHLLKNQLVIRGKEGVNEEDTLRQEIRSLRHIRNRLIDKIPEVIDKQRQVLVISEYIETIDVMIEQKNEMICGKKDMKDKKSKKLYDQMAILKRLEELSHDELVTLFYKYFHKVIDLKESSKNLEIQNATLEESLKKEAMENETKIMMLQRSYERKIGLLLNYYAEETSSSSYDNRLDRPRDIDKVMKENQHYKRRVAHFESLLKASSTACAVQSNPVEKLKPGLKPELMQLALPTKTKVTRQGNKLIFQTKKGK
ncbi:hypothetical protein QAD02_007135 [Eretmocerus hayati]|uniref:Uncharacterized protein n=1 Tax=Eretmocerus hayati TaxID=131215 RepID=A0ACC2N3C5_9HYME|nr:hypothetical protein QAD02_007135 [Eretmocerus hayati]